MCVYVCMQAVNSIVYHMQTIVKSVTHCVLILFYNHVYSPDYRSSLKLMYVDIWPLQVTQSTEWWH